MIYEKTVVYDDGAMRLALEFFRGRAYLHFKVQKFSASVLRKTRWLWAETQKILLAIGYDKVIAYTPEGTPAKWFKFVGRFGFKPVRRLKGMIIVEAPLWKR